MIISCGARLTLSRGRSPRREGPVVVASVTRSGGAPGAKAHRGATDPGSALPDRDAWPVTLQYPVGSGEQNAPRSYHGQRMERENVMRGFHFTANYAPLWPRLASHREGRRRRAGLAADVPPPRFEAIGLSGMLPPHAASSIPVYQAQGLVRTLRGSLLLSSSSVSDLFAYSFGEVGRDAYDMPAELAACLWINQNGLCFMNSDASGIHLPTEYLARLEVWGCVSELVRMAAMAAKESGAGSGDAATTLERQPWDAAFRAKVVAGRGWAEAMLLGTVVAVTVRVTLL